jgi:hypothetical protein
MIKTYQNHGIWDDDNMIKIQDYEYYWIFVVAASFLLSARYHYYA